MELESKDELALFKLLVVVLGFVKGVNKVVFGIAPVFFLIVAFPIDCLKLLLFKVLTPSLLGRGGGRSAAFGKEKRFSNKVFGSIGRGSFVYICSAWGSWSGRAEAMFFLTNNRVSIFSWMLSLMIMKE